MGRVIGRVIGRERGLEPLKVSRTSPGHELTYRIVYRHRWLDLDQLSPPAAPIRERRMSPSVLLAAVLIAPLRM